MIEPQKGTDSLMFALSGVTTTGGATLDTLGADYASIRVAFASELTTDAVGPTISVLSCENSTVSNFATLVADRTTEDLTAARVVTYHIDMRGKARYLRMTVDPVGTAATDDAVTCCAVGTLYRQVELPGATTDMADAAVIL